jgi:porin
MLVLGRLGRVVRTGGLVAFTRVAYALCLAVAALGGVSSSAAQTLGVLDSHGIPEPSIATSLPQYADPAGARKRLSERGFTYYLIYTNDILSNLSGGTRRGTVDQGKLEAQFTLDLGKFAGWNDLTLYANVFQTHNTGRMRRDYVGGLNTIAAIEANPSVRLSELWLERKFWDGAASLRVGQLVADNEFFFSDLSNMFMQTDWPTITAANLPGGAPAYPLSTPGARLKFEIAPDIALLAAVFNGDPAGPCAGDPDTCNRYGLNFRLRDPALGVAEAQFRTNQGKDDTGLARTVKIGGWHQLGQFADQRMAIDGTLLADPAGNGVPAQRRGNYGVYGIIDQQIYRPRGAAADGGISVYGLASITPSDRNLISAQLNGGIVFAGFTPGRPDDRFGMSVVYSRFSSGARAFDQDMINISGVPGTVRDYEANFELSYVAQIVHGWTVQPDFQYIRHPSGVAGRDAKVLGVRTMLKF